MRSSKERLGTVHAKLGHQFAELAKEVEKYSATQKDRHKLVRAKGDMRENRISRRFLDERGAESDVRSASSVGNVAGSRRKGCLIVLCLGIDE